MIRKYWQVFTILSMVFIPLWHASESWINETFFEGVGQPQEEVSISVYYPEIPVLKGKKYNPILRIDIQRTDDDWNALVGNIVVDLTNCSRPKSIESLMLFRTTEGGFSSGELLCEFTPSTTVMSLPASRALGEGINHFWLAAELSESAQLSDLISARVQSVVINSVNQIVADAVAEYQRVGVALRKHGDDGIHTYRIPGLVTTNTGTLIGVYDNRRNGGVDLQEDIDIGMNRSVDGGETWSSMEVIMDMNSYGGLPEDQNGIGDPSILVDRQTNTIWVAAIWAHGHPGERNWFASKQGMTPEQTSQFMLCKSTDDGLSWSDPINITDQVKDPSWHLFLQGPGKGITMADGTLVFPAQFKDKDEMPHSTIIHSSDHGQTWKVGTGAKSNTTEAQVVELSDHSLMLNMRDNRGRGEGLGTGARSILITKDMGKTWTEHPTSRSALIEPVCMASLVSHTYQDKEYLIFSNPADQHHREKITIKLSSDEGNTWPTPWQTLLDEGRGRGYSCLTSIDENTIGILYEGSQADLVFQRIAFADLLHQ